MNPQRTALLVVDLQHDFMPAGALGVPAGDEIVAPVRDLLRCGPFRHCIATQDWHPPQHASFASRHPERRPLETMMLYGHEQVLWPDHCVQGTHGAELVPGIPWERMRAILRKGVDPAVDSYSAFRENWNAAGERPPTGLAGLLRELGCDAVVLCGLARDYCVAWSAQDAVDAGFRSTVIWELTRPVDPASDDDVRATLKAKGVSIITMDALPDR